MIDVQEKDGILSVRGPYGEMAEVYPKLKTWGFRYNGTDRSWWIKADALTPLKRKRFDELVGPQKPVAPPPPKAPPPLVELTPRLKDLADRALAMKADLAMVGVAVGYFKSLMPPAYNLYFEGAIGPFGPALHKAGAETSGGRATFNLLKTDADDLDRFLDSITPQIAAAKKKVETIANLVGPIRGWFGVSFVPNTKATEYSLMGKSFPYAKAVKKHFRQPRFFNGWIVSALKEDPADFEAFIKAADQVSKDLAAEAQKKSEPAPARTPPRRENSRPGYCRRCGGLVPAGQGWLSLEYDDDNDRDKWTVEHKDRKVCDSVLEVQRMEAELANNRAKARKELREYATTKGVMPTGMNELDGKRVYLQKQGIVYGGGSWVVIEPDERHFWYVENNGMDGDNWSYNNVVTGGAGAIGYRAPLDDMARLLIEVAKE